MGARFKSGGGCVGDAIGLEVVIELSLANKGAEAFEFPNVRTGLVGISDGTDFTRSPRADSTGAMLPGDWIDIGGMILPSTETIELTSAIGSTDAVGKILPRDDDKGSALTTGEGNVVSNDPPSAEIKEPRLSKDWPGGRGGGVIKGISLCVGASPDENAILRRENPVGRDEGRGLTLRADKIFSGLRRRGIAAEVRPDIAGLEEIFEGMNLLADGEGNRFGLSPSSDPRGFKSTMGFSVDIFGEFEVVNVAGMMVVNVTQIDEAAGEA